MNRFSTESLFEIADVLGRGLEVGPVVFEAVDPDESRDHFPGESIVVDGQQVVYRCLHTWVELAEGLGAVLETPERLPGGFVRLRMRPLRAESSWHDQSRASGDPEKYGADTVFARTSKLETPSFLRSYLEAFRFLDLPANARVLSVGVNQGHELGLFDALGQASGMTLVGLDHSPSAIAAAQLRYPQPCFQFIAANVEDIDSLDLGGFDLVIAINTLHSPALDGHGVFQSLVKNQMVDGGGFIVGVPNSRYVDHRLVYGARMKNYSTPEMSLLWKEVGYFRRYLHQHEFRVRVFGKHTMLIVGKHHGTRA